MQYLVSHYRLLSQEPGIYLFLDKKGNIIYIGKAKNLKSRVSSYFVNKSALGDKTKTLVSQVNKIETTPVNSEIDALLLEAKLITKHKPKFNLRWIDDKAYPLIRITWKDKYPKVLTARREDDNLPAGRSIYFGPFPSANSVRFVLRTLRRIFPFQSVLNHPKRPCFYFHLGLCPCPEVFKDKNYRKNICYIIRFLEGKTKGIINELKRERNQLTKNENFEAANVLQKKIDAIKLVTSPIHKPFEYETNPNLILDLRKNELTDLKLILEGCGIKINDLGRIECYDVSNISGTNLAGSMIVFINGERDTSQYRRFKMDPKKYQGKQNDPAMLREVIERRIKHEEWQFPSLIVVDGGKGQVSSALSVLKSEKISIPLIGLAKREETIIVPKIRSLLDQGDSLEKYKEVRLPTNSKALHLIQRIRDEAHRFAIAYHRKLRSKNFFSSDPWG